MFVVRYSTDFIGYIIKKPRKFDKFTGNPVKSTFTPDSVKSLRWSSHWYR